MLFDEAVQQASALGRLAPSGSGLRLLNNSTQQLLPSSFQNKLESLSLQSSGSLAKMGGAGETRRVSQGTTYVFSDFQRNAFSNKTIESLPVNNDVVLVPLLGKKSGNVYVDSVWVEEAFVRTRSNVLLHVRLRNGGNVSVTDCGVKVYFGAGQVAAYRVSLELGATVTSVVAVQIQTEALVRGRVEVDDAPVTFDNDYFFTLQPTSVIRVLEIGAEPIAERLYGNESLFKYTFAKVAGLDYGIMRQANLVVVREVIEISAGLREGLQGVLKRGGSVVVVPPVVATGRKSYQQFFADSGLGAVQWENVSATPELREVAMPSAREPFFRDVFGASQRMVAMPRVAPVLRWSRTGRDLMRLRDGENYLAEFSSGAGRVYVFSAPFAPAYSDFVTHALFVPVMYRMAMLSYRNEQLPAYRLTQQTVSLQIPAGAIDRERGEAPGFRLVKDSLTLVPAQRLLGQELRFDVPVGMDAPGFYQVQRQGKVLTTLAFNQDKRESELAAYSAAELRELIGPNRPNIRVLEGNARGDELATLRAEQTGQPLWRYFLLLALLCLLFEGLIVRFGARPIALKTAGSVA